MNAVQLYDYEYNTLRAICNTLVPGLNGEGPAFKREIETLISGVESRMQLQLRLVLQVLSFRGTAFPLTRSHKLLTEMSKDEVLGFIYILIQSRIPKLRMLGSGLLSMTVMARYRYDAEFRKVLGDYDPHPHLIEIQKATKDMWFIPKFNIPRPLSSHEPAVISTDVVLVGSGCSAMVAAYRLTQKGFKVIIVEKGYHLNSMTSPSHDFVRDKEAFENQGVLNSVDSSIFMLAGATVGGGGAVNWSCSLRPTEQVRSEWVNRGAPIFGTPAFDNALDEVERIMRVSTEFGTPETNDTKHSFTNQLILDSSKKLRYKAYEAGQNTGKHRANSGFVEFGSRQGSEKGGIAEWFRYSMENGANFLQRSEVIRIRHSNGHASGVEVATEGRPLLINCKRVVCCAGSLNTPVLLQRSKFKNNHIGKGLKLHPVTVVYGEFPEPVNRRLDPIMTTVCTEMDNVDGEGHGPKIEAINHRPNLLLLLLPYRSPEDWSEKAHRSRHFSTLLVITRDKGEGKVSYSPSRTKAPLVEYTPSNYDMQALHRGSLAGANMLYVGGATRIFLSSSRIPDFVSSKPAAERSIWDPDFRSWYELARKTEFWLYDTRFGSAHQMASCRMNSRGPKHGAVDAQGHLYECRNVHVIDTSVFPSASGVNPMITCMATAYALTEFLINDLVKLQTKL